MEDTLEKIMSTAQNHGHDAYPAIKSFLDQVNTVPKWYDAERIRRGQDFFIRRQGSALSSLLYLSLIGGFGAPRINKGSSVQGTLASYPEP